MLRCSNRVRFSSASILLQLLIKQTRDHGQAPGAFDDIYITLSPSLPSPPPFLLLFPLHHPFSFSSLSTTLSPSLPSPSPFLLLFTLHHPFSFSSLSITLSPSLYSPPPFLL